MTRPNPAYSQVRPAELRERLGRGEPLRVIDVREPLEHRIAVIEGAELIPLGLLPAHVHRFDRDEEIVIVCHHGIRSAQACEYLAGLGFTRLSNVIGGIDLWSIEVDPGLPRY